MRVLITGATGFVGKAVVGALRAAGHEPRAAVRRNSPGSDIEQVLVGEIGPATDWTAALAGTEAVVHLAARVHVMHPGAEDEALFQRVNVAGTRRLAEAAVASGVRRLVFMSSIKVNGEATGDRPFRADDPPAPQDAYGRSKRDAEQVLRELPGLETVIIRPSLVYGPGVRGNLARLCALAARGVPVPFGSIRNQRDLLGVANLASLVERCLVHPGAVGRTFLACDGEAMSTPDLYARIARALGREPRLLPVPVGLLSLVARPLGMQAEIARLTGSLQMDSAPTRTTLDWSPPQDIDTGIAAMTQVWREVGT